LSMNIKMSHQPTFYIKYLLMYIYSKTNAMSATRLALALLLIFPISRLYAQPLLYDIHLPDIQPDPTEWLAMDLDLRQHKGKASGEHDLLSEYNQKMAYAGPRPNTWGVGIRLGDPTGFTAKKYLRQGRAWEYILGRPAGWWYGDNYYRDRFRDKNLPEDTRFDRIRNYNALSFQMHYLIHHDFPDAPGLQWYYGFGGQLRISTFDYYYSSFVSTGPGNNGFWRAEVQRGSAFGLGADGVLGMEYTFSEAPISVFLDLNLYLEIFERPFFAAGQLGLGLRYNF
jgi:hypothetical protein